MSLRARLNRQPALAAGLVFVAISACGWVIWTQTAGASGASVPNTALFTVDEGQSLFSDQAGRLTPFDKDGKAAVRAHVYRCPDGTEVVAYLERYTERGKAVMEQYRAEQKATPGQPPPSLGQLAALGLSATEVKRPGDKQ